MKNCSVCHNELNRFHSFRFLQGRLCPDCYKKASLYFSRPVTNLTYEEVMDNINKAGTTPEDFEISEKIGPFFAVDNKNRKFAILKGGRFQKEFSQPRIFRISQLKTCSVQSSPEKEKSELSVIFRMKNGNCEKIVLADKPVRTASFGFRKSLYLAERIKKSAENLQQF